MTGIEALLDLSPTPKVFVAATGAGAGIQASLWSVPGSSAFLAGAAFPYAAYETERLLGFRPARFCDEDAAVELAIAAYLRGREAALAETSGAPTKAPVVGLGLMASVASLEPHRGDHRVFVATLGERGATVWSARLPKGTGEAQRSIDGQLADRLGVHALLAAVGIAREAGDAPGVEVSRRELPEAELHAMLYRRPVFGPGDSREKALGTERCDLVLLPGSFDPCHEGHQMIADAVERQYGRRVAYAVTADPVHKPSLRTVDLLDRVASIHLEGGRTHTIVLTERDPLFIDKARQFPGAGIALGVDALVRMLDPSWGPNVGEMLETFRALGTRFYVVGRSVDGHWTTIDDMPIPDRFRRLFESVEGRHDVSSTELRGLHEVGGSRRSMMLSLLEPPLLSRLKRHDRILIAGAGGGFDVYAGLPLAVALRSAGKQVFLANLTFTYLGETDVQYLAPHVAAVTAATTGADRYFPERRLAEWLAEQEQPSTIYALEKVGVAPLRAAYARLVEELAVQAIVLVDGGTDILMRGDEAGLGTPEEDMTSLAAVSKLDAVESFVVSIGFGVDAFHGVCHAHVLENIAAIERDGGYLGAFAVTAAMPEGRAYLSAVSHAQSWTPGRPSIVNGSIAAAIEGSFGNVRFSDRTAQSELFINPLMAIYFAFDLPAVAKQSLYLHLLEGTESIFDVGLRIEAFRHTVQPRPRMPIPH